MMNDCIHRGLESGFLLVNFRVSVERSKGEGWVLKSLGKRNDLSLRRQDIRGD